MKEKSSYLIIIIISVICIALSITIQIEKKQYESAQESICSAITGSDGCEAVQTSRYASTLGVDNPVYGVAGFTLLAILAAAYIKKSAKVWKYLIMTGSIIAAAVATYFLYLQAFVLHRYCIFCIIVDTLSLVLLGISAYIMFADRIHSEEIKK